MGGQDITIRPETAADHDAIRHVNQEAFDLTSSRCTSGSERITRKTAVADEFPIQVVCDWIGNTEPVASKYYLQVTEDHFAKAVQNPVQQAAPRRFAGCHTTGCSKLRPSTSTDWGPCPSLERCDASPGGVRIR